MTVNANTRKIADLLQQKRLSHAQIAKLVGVDRRRVYQVRKYLEANGIVHDFYAGHLVFLREQRGWSVRELARRAQVHPSQVGRWEMGRSVPRAAQWEKVAAALGVRPEVLRKRRVSA